MPKALKPKRKRVKYTQRERYPTSYPCGCKFLSAHKRLDGRYGCRCGALWRLRMEWVQDAPGSTQVAQQAPH